MGNNANQGEGNSEADRQYREGARRFVEEGRVPAAADNALAANDAAGVRVVETARASSEDSDPLPTFWTARQQSGWDRVKVALRRDWLQTKRDLGMGGGAELGQSVVDTVKQATGSEPMPNGEEAGINWDLARHAIRLGHGAATFWPDDTEWSEALEGRVRAEWTAVGSGIEWTQALPLVRHGWELGRADMED